MLRERPLWIAAVAMLAITSTWLVVLNLALLLRDLPIDLGAGAVLAGTMWRAALSFGREALPLAAVAIAIGVLMVWLAIGEGPGELERARDHE